MCARGCWPPLCFVWQRLAGRLFHGGRTQRLSAPALYFFPQPLRTIFACLNPVPLQRISRMVAHTLRCRLSFPLVANKLRVLNNEVGAGRPNYLSPADPHRPRLLLRSPGHRTASTIIHRVSLSLTANLSSQHVVRCRHGPASRTDTGLCVDICLPTGVAALWTPRDGRDLSRPRCNAGLFSAVFVGGSSVDY